MTTYVRINGKIVDKATVEYQPSTAPYVISDTLGTGLRHMATGQMTDSKSQFRRMTKDSGCVELGYERPRARQPVRLSKEQRKDDIRRAFYEHRNGRHGGAGRNRPF